jgi:hypothetical protein
MATPRKQEIPMTRSARIGSFLVACLALSPSARAGDVSVRLDSGAGFSLKNAAGAVERLRVDEATGNVSRNGALFVHTTGMSSLYVGDNAGSPANTGGQNTGVGPNALRSVITGSRNAAFGISALRYDTIGSDNSAFGAAALLSNVNGYGNAAFGSRALVENQFGSRNTGIGAFALRYNIVSGNTALGFAALSYNSVGTSNAAVGAYALASSSTGYSNAAFGESALRSNTTAPQNSAFGWSALRDNTTGGGNSAVGSFALRANTTGGSNVGVGQTALRSNTTGSDNTALGRGALYSSTGGSRNIAVGMGAGNGQTTGNDNIYLASAGVAGESGRIRIGTVGTHVQTQLAGIHGATSAGGVAVLVNPSGVLGTTTSSARFKRDVEDMGDASDLLMRLRPVRFHYLESAVGAEESRVEQYGLIAEEVAEVAPELVAPDGAGKPYSVKYHVLPALLLNKIQQQERTIVELSSRLAALEMRAVR